MTEKIYPGVFDRVKAIVADGIILLVFMFAASSIFSLFETVPDFIRVFAFVFIFLLYDPLFTSFTGGTIGHRLIGIRVRKEQDETCNITFLPAVLRYIVKALLGWVSLLTISGNNKGRAIHDYVAGSVVVYAKPENEQNSN
jgi:uncharacterized RDD family membrane protein YckC